VFEDVIAFHIPVKASAISLEDCVAASVFFPEYFVFCSEYFFEKSILTAQDCTKNLSLLLSRADCPKRAWLCSNVCLSLSTNRMETVSVPLGATKPWLGRTR